MSRRMIPTENVEVKPDGQLILQSNHRDLVVKGDATFTGDIDAQNGVLQIDQIVLPAGATQSVKKIYCHPIKIYNGTDATNKFMLTALIFNNDPTAFTLATFKQWLINLVANVGELTTIMVSGYYNYSASNKIIQSASYLYITTYNLAGIDGANVGGTDYESTGNLTLDTLFPSGSFFSDGVNPIN